MLRISIVISHYPLYLVVSPVFFSVKAEVQSECEKYGAVWMTGSNYDEAETAIRAVGFGARMATFFVLHNTLM